VLTIVRQLWLLGYEFPHTLFVLTPDLLQIVTTKKKGASDRSAELIEKC
jgi:nucleosome binding factor SPN SPT16 subunit